VILRDEAVLQALATNRRLKGRLDLEGQLVVKMKLGL